MTPYISIKILYFKDDTITSLLYMNTDLLILDMNIHQNIMN